MLATLLVPVVDSSADTLFTAETNAGTDIPGRCLAELAVSLELIHRVLISLRTRRGAKKGAGGGGTA